MKSIVCFGEALIDFQPIKKLNPSEPARFEQHAGGAPANVAVAVATLGGRAEFVGMLGSDTFGDFLLDSLLQKGVGIEHVQRTSAAPTALAFVSLDEQGERSFSFYRSPAADLLFRESKLPTAVFDEAAVFHVCSNSLTEEGIAQTTLACMLRARDAGVLVSFDMNLRPLLWPHGVDPAPRILRALALADIIKLSAVEFAFLADICGGELAALDEIWKHHAEFIVITDGANPLRWFSRLSSDCMEPYTVSAIDSTAAGDAFTGGFLYSLTVQQVSRLSFPALLADRKRLDQLLVFASACGALAVTRRGACSAMPGRIEVESLIANATTLEERTPNS